MLITNSILIPPFTHEMQLKKLYNKVQCFIKCTQVTPVATDNNVTICETKSARSILQQIEGSLKLS